MTKGIMNFIVAIIMIPIYASLIYVIKNLEDVETLDERWKYRENIYPTGDYKKYRKYQV